MHFYIDVFISFEKTAIGTRKPTTLLMATTLNTSAGRQEGILIIKHFS